jgi:outer membrane protein assembly factor BamB
MRAAVILLAIGLCSVPPLLALTCPSFTHATALADQPPKPLWTFDTKSPSYGSASVGDVDGDGKPEIVFGTYYNDEHLYCLDAATGRVKWKLKSEGGPFDASATIADVDGDGKPEVLAADSSTGTLFAVSGDGKVKWKHRLPNSTDSPPAIADIDGDGHVEIVVGVMWLKGGSGRVLALDAKTREVKWSAEVPGCVQSEPALVDLNGDGVLDAIVTSWRGDKSVHALSGKDGKLLWKFEASGDMYHGVSVFRAGGELRIAFATCAGDVYALDKTGKQLWTLHLGGYLFAPTAVADLDADGSLDIVVPGDRITVVSASGKQMWQSESYGSISRGAAIADWNGDGTPDVLFGASDRKFRGLDGKTGRELFEYDATVKGEVYESIGSAPVVADFDGDGRLDVFFVVGKGTSDETKPQNYGRAVALKGLAGRGPGWPTFRGNLLRTGASR